MTDVDKLRRAMTELRTLLPAVLEHQIIMAQVTRARYNALIKEGFTEAQAIELCKQVAL